MPGVQGAGSDLDQPFLNGRLRPRMPTALSPPRPAGSFTSRRVVTAGVLQLLSGLTLDAGLERRPDAEVVAVAVRGTSNGVWADQCSGLRASVQSTSKTDNSRDASSGKCDSQTPRAHHSEAVTDETSLRDAIWPENALEPAQETTCARLSQQPLA